jgi:CheY-like chemotaxis protein/regulator of replication initiation timing
MDDKKKNKQELVNELLILRRENNSLKSRLSGSEGKGYYIKKEIEPEEKLTEIKRRYSELMEQTRDVIFVLSNQGIVVSLNHAFERITGWQMEECIGKPLTRLLHPDDVTLVEERISNILKGLIFHFIIPYKPEAIENGNAGHPVPNRKEEFALKSLNILIAEDDESSEILMSRALRTIGKKILKVRTGVAAVQACRSNNEIDLIMMDIKMPEMDGYEATRQIRQFDKEVIIIAQTAYAQMGDSEKAIVAGCNDYISKPINKEELITIIEKYFKS